MKGPRVATGRGRSMTQPHWMTNEEFRTTLGEFYLKDKEQADDLEKLMQDAEPNTAMCPVNAPALSRTVILRNAFSPKKLAANPYLNGDEDEGEEGEITAGMLARIESKTLYQCAQFGFVRFTTASEDCSVLVAFAVKESAKKCVDAMHGRIVEDRQIVADYDVRGAGATRVSKAVWISNVFNAVAPPQTPPRGLSEFVAQIESDFNAEGSRFGPVVHVTAIREEGCVHIVYESIVSAGDCIHAMNGRWFDERQMWAEYDLEYVDREEELSAETGQEGQASFGESRSDVQSGLATLIPEPFDDKNSAAAKTVREGTADDWQFPGTGSIPTDNHPGCSEVAKVLQQQQQQTPSNKFRPSSLVTKSVHRVGGAQQRMIDGIYQGSSDQSVNEGRKRGRQLLPEECCGSEGKSIAQAPPSFSVLQPVPQKSCFMSQNNNNHPSVLSSSINMLQMTRNLAERAKRRKAEETKSEGG
eukprot:CAMPEP_0185778986 /NCGR_PEP_ID=MMETSP1174-20130828/94263_1 /TAXON_ID=35687 /ORGANISM="Dictyocha speculum, Strain CCMP1381" /LENGTH=471 /DNA_ID=CAMNT_0028467921 /DNA_START=214 /DNA_END=1626 /DNA_ORIENTATION=-